MQRGNDIGPDGCKELVTVLPKLVNLTGLDLVREMGGQGDVGSDAVCVIASMTHGDGWCVSAGSQRHWARRLQTSCTCVVIACEPY